MQVSLPCVYNFIFIGCRARAGRTFNKVKALHFNRFTARLHPGHQNLKQPFLMLSQVLASQVISSSAVSRFKPYS